jgi:hypothetical protein
LHLSFAHEATPCDSLYGELLRETRDRPVPVLKRGVGLFNARLVELQHFCRRTKKNIAGEGGLMNTKRLVIGTLVGAIVIYLLGDLIWGILFADFFDSNSGSAIGVTREESIIWAVAFGSVLYSLLLNFGLELKQNGRSILNGVIVGAVVGALIWGTADFIEYGITTIDSLTGTVADTLLEGVRGAIAGGIVVALLGLIKA